MSRSQRIRTAPRITEVVRRTGWPQRPRDFNFTGTRAQLDNDLGEDHALDPLWDYVVYEDEAAPGLWLVWREPKGTVNSNLGRKV